jgi:hypothetical protein
MPWIPELFSGPALKQVFDQAAVDKRITGSVPYFDGVWIGEVDALVSSFAGEPELHHPVRGRVKGRRAFEHFVAETNAWLSDHDAVWGPPERIVTSRRGIEETLMTFEGDEGRTELPVAVAADRDDAGRITELRVYYSGWPLRGAHSIRSPLLQPDPELKESDIIGEYQAALAAGDAQTAASAFESDAYVREPAGGSYIHRDQDGLLALFTQFFSNGGGIPLEHCAVTDDGRSCALEYNVVRWGRTELPPQAGLAVYVRGDSGKLAGARIYDDVDPPL